jgi:hypothetical protein
MPLCGFICDLSGEKVSFEDCISCSNDPTKPFCQATPNMLRGMCAGLQERREAGISVTTLTGCLRSGFYNISTDYYHNPSKLYPAFRGTLGHLLMELGKDPETICETRFARYLDSGVLLTGKPDLYDPRRKLLIDFKTKQKLPESPPVEYVEQMCGYRLILADGYAMDSGEHVNYEIESMGLVFLTMMEYVKMPVPIMDTDQVMDLFSTRAALVEGALRGGELPPRDTSNPTKSTLCREWCPHYQVCLAS